MIQPLSDPLFRPGMAAFASAVVRARLRQPTVLEQLQFMRQQGSRLDVFV